MCRLGVSVSEDCKSVMEVTFDVEGMVCMSCVKSIEAALSDKAGVVNGRASLERNQAWARFDSRRVGMEEVRLTIEDCGFDVVIAGAVSRRSVPSSACCVRFLFFFRVDY